MKYKKTCEHCGHEITAYTFSLNKSMVNALSRLVDLYERERKPIAKPDLNLSNSQYTNFCHLAYFELAKMVEDHWVPTELGMAFIHGETSIVLPIARMGKQNLAPDHEAWKTHEGERYSVTVSDIDVMAYKRRPEYARERATTTLF